MRSGADQPVTDQSSSRSHSPLPTVLSTPLPYLYEHSTCDSQSMFTSHGNVT